jgi:MinD-like ATPase involved in chromosome partitioning or flagellar assembly
MIKSWYLHVRDETMAPARMISFIEQHAATCSVCQEDPDLREEIAKITELILPESKIPKAIRQANSDLEDDEDYDEEYNQGEDEEGDDDDADSEEEDEDIEDIEEDEFFDDEED